LPALDSGPSSPSPLEFLPPFTILPTSIATSLLGRFHLFLVHYRSADPVLYAQGHGSDGGVRVSSSVASAHDLPHHMLYSYCTVPYFATRRSAALTHHLPLATCHLPLATSHLRPSCLSLGVRNVRRGRNERECFSTHQSFQECSGAQCACIAYCLYSSAVVSSRCRSALHKRVAHRTTPHCPNPSIPSMALKCICPSQRTHRSSSDLHRVDPRSMPRHSFVRRQPHARSTRHARLSGSDGHPHPRRLD
jgi:hypothetical protein